jgi:integrase
LHKASADDRPVFATMAYTGMRFGDVRDLRWAELQLKVGQHGKIFLKRGGSANTTMGKSNRMIHLLPDSIPSKIPCRPAWHKVHAVTHKVLH